MAATTVKKVFKSTFPSVQYFFRNGKQAAFINHRYITSIESEIAELEEEIKSHLNPHLYIDANETEVAASEKSALETIKEQALKEARAQVLKEMEAATAKSNDRGTSAQYNPTAGMVNSNTIAEAMSGSDSAAGADAPVGKLTINVGKAGK